MRFMLLLLRRSSFGMGRGPERADQDAAQSEKGQRMNKVKQMDLPPAPAQDREPPSSACGAVAEWSKALAWKVSIRQKRIEGSNPSRSATYS